MSDEAKVNAKEVKLECLKLCDGNIEKAKEMFNFVLESEPDVLGRACKPWLDGSLEPPEHDSPLHVVFQAGMYRMERLLANLLRVPTYTVSEGSDNIDTDAQGTLANILIAAGYRTEDGDLAKPHEIAQTAPAPPTVSDREEGKSEQDAPLHERFPAGKTGRDYESGLVDGATYLGERKEDRTPAYLDGLAAGRVLRDEADPLADALVDDAVQNGLGHIDDPAPEVRKEDEQDAAGEDDWEPSEQIWTVGGGSYTTERPPIAKAAPPQEAPAIPEGFIPWSGATAQETNPNIDPITEVEIVHRDGRRDIGLAGDYEWEWADVLRVMVPEFAADFQAADDIVGYRPTNPTPQTQPETSALDKVEDAPANAAFIAEAELAINDKSEDEPEANAFADHVQAIVADPRQNHLIWSVFPGGVVTDVLHDGEKVYAKVDGDWYDVPPVMAPEPGKFLPANVHQVAANYDPVNNTDQPATTEQLEAENITQPVSNDFAKGLLMEAEAKAEPKPSFIERVLGIPPKRTVDA